MRGMRDGHLPMKLHFPARTGDAAWEGEAPDALEHPELYDGLALRRSLAWFLDMIVLFFLGVTLWGVVGLLTVASFFALTPLTVPLGILMAAFLPLLYHSYFIGKTGASPAMALFDLEVRSWNGSPASMAQGFLHSAIFFATVMPSTWLILVVAFLNTRRRCLHDFLAGTVVVRASRLRSYQA